MKSFPVSAVVIYYISIQTVTMVRCGWFSSQEKSESPIVLWWTSFTGENGNWRTCGEQTCFFTENRTYLSHPKTKVVVFYASSFSPFDLPIPRQPSHDWALLHEESPKNNPSFCYHPLISLFNYTATWSRKSSFPLTLLSLPKLSDITDKKYYVPVADKNTILIQEGLSPVVYVQSSCDAPSERDSYVIALQKFINVDSYGKCLNNKPLPAQLENPADAMKDEEFLRLVAKYKFAIAFENAIGDDYITEKLWRPLTLGSVPIYLGSPSVKDWMPHHHSVLSVWNFISPESLADHIHVLNNDDEAYNRMLVHKTRGTMENKLLVDAMKSRLWTAGGDDEDFQSQNFVEAFECFLCLEIHRKQREEDAGYSAQSSTVDTAHFSCPPPINPVTRQFNPDNWWLEHWNHARAEANVIERFARRNLNYTSDEFHQSLFQEIANGR